MRATPAIKLSLFFAISFLVPSNLFAQADPSISPLPVFEFHSGFWLNLHHTLYRQARLQRNPGSSTVVPMSNLSAWTRKHGTLPSAITWKPTPERICFQPRPGLDQEQLGDLRLAIDLAGLKKARPATRGFQNGSRKCSTALLRFIARICGRSMTRQSPLDFGCRPVSAAQRGRPLASPCEIYETSWPRERIRVDVTAYANAAGAYTTLDPLRLLSPARCAKSGPEALKSFFTKHRTVSPTSAGRNPSRMSPTRQARPAIWHALLFYTTGEIIRPQFSPRQGGAKNRLCALRRSRRTLQASWEDYLRCLPTTGNLILTARRASTTPSPTWFRHFSFGFKRWRLIRMTML